ncbi:malto-oligosyltrehalose trehalohydrolase [Tundrisphaera sp. TA3]|uniref:malto-oligosyltrehalose trehalohydrolase n=1 Tax=Tundrisphaera sp. TA3 TaxID=3435775 RepID=UPI003EB92BDF
MPWRPSLGAWPETGGIRFRVWAPRAERVSVVLEGASEEIPLDRFDDGTFGAITPRAGVGDRYRYRVDGAGPFPDPASRSQPEGVHGPSEILDPSRFAWTDHVWRGPDRDGLSIYELHIGSFTPEGTYAAAAGRLEALRDLGVTAIEVLPLNDFPGRWGWGYDGVALFAPARCYGSTDDLRRFVDHAHSLGLAVLLDVVHNHLGPDGNYTGCFSADYTSPGRPTPWGPAINLLDEGSEMVRAFFAESCLHWLHEYHFDGFRFDATHALVDGDRPLCAEIVAKARAAITDRTLIFVAEDHRNLDMIVRPASVGGWDLDGVWADDFHHFMRCYLTGDADGVYQDFEGTTANLAATIGRGWFFRGEWSAYREKYRGTDPTGIPPQRFIFCTQNHDRIGNRGRGERLNHDLDPATFRAATAALLCSPETPMLFMGQEWAASTPFFYFTDHKEELGVLIHEGRRTEFRKYRDFADPARLALIPDPQAEATFRAGVLDWTERDREPHAGVWRLHHALLELRKDPAFRDGGFDAQPVGDDGLALRLGIGTGHELRAVIRLRGEGDLAPGWPSGGTGDGEVVLQTEDASFVTDPEPIAIVPARLPTAYRFRRPGAIVMRWATAKPSA